MADMDRAALVVRLEQLAVRAEADGANKPGYSSHHTIIDYADVIALRDVLSLLTAEPTTDHASARCFRSGLERLASHWERHHTEAFQCIDELRETIALLTAEPERPQDTLLDAFKAGFSVAQHETDKYGEYHGESVEDEFRAWAAMGAEPERRAPEGR